GWTLNLSPKGGDLDEYQVIGAMGIYSVVGGAIQVILWEDSCYFGSGVEIGKMGGEERIMVLREACPQCGSTWVKRNGHIHTGKQNHRCKLCGRAFVLNPDNKVITEEQRTLVEHLLLERISLRGICRAVGVGLQWLLQFM